MMLGLAEQLSHDLLGACDDALRVIEKASAEKGVVEDLLGDEFSTFGIALAES